MAFEQLSEHFLTSVAMKMDGEKKKDFNFFISFSSKGESNINLIAMERRAKKVYCNLIRNI